MLDAVHQILIYTTNKTFSDFESDRLIQDGVIRNIEILGEASRRLLDAFPQAGAQFPCIPFVAIYAMRNQLSHGYFTVDLEIVWKVVERDIPQLRVELENAVATLDHPPNA
jgi:uncharacterized protein with HEPN domain